MINHHTPHTNFCGIKAHLVRDRLSVTSLSVEGAMTLLLSVLFLTLCAAEICSAAEVDEDTRHLLKKSKAIVSYLLS